MTAQSAKHVAILIAVEVAIVIGLFVTFANVVQATAVARITDFGRFYYAVSGSRVGASLYRPAPENPGLNWNPPHFSLLIAPFERWLSVEHAFVAWTILSVLCLLFALRIVWRNIPAAAPSARLWVAAILLWSAPFHAMLTSGGQVTWILLLPLALAWDAAHRGQTTRSAIWLTMAVSVKPFLAPIYLWYFVKGAPGRPLLAAVLTFSGLLAAGGGWFGMTAIVEWINRPAAADFEWADHFLNSSLAALLAHGVHPASLPRWWILTAGVLLVSAWTVVRHARADLDVAWTLLVFAGLLASPLGWIYYWWFAVPSVLAVIHSGKVDRFWVAIVLVGTLWPMRFGMNASASVYPVTLVLAWLLLTIQTWTGGGSVTGRILVQS